MKKYTLALASGTLGLGIAEFAMMGILPDVASKLSITIPEAGYFISSYALGGLIGAFLLVFVARKMPLKKVLMGLILIYIVGNLGFALSSSYSLNLVFRTIAGIPHGAFFGVGAIVARKLADKGSETSSVAGMVAGMTFANLVGVPIGTFISHHFSWSITYLMVAFIGVFVLWAIKTWIPYIAPLPDSGGLKGQFKFLGKLDIWLIIAVTILGNGGIFCWYSYINPLMTKVVGFHDSAMTGVMVIAGLGMVVGNLISGKLSDRFLPQKVGMCTQGIAAVTLFLIFIFIHNQAASLIFMFVGTACLFAVSSPQQVLFLKNAEGGQMLGAALAQVAFNIGNALGAFCGGLPISRGYSYEYSTIPGIGLTFVGFIIFIYYTKRSLRERQIQ